MFIVIEGIDGAGKGRQRNELVRLFSDRSGEVGTTDFPDHQGKVYKHIIHPALHEEFELSNQAWFLAFALDQLLWKDRIADSIGSNTKHFISDGYFTTTLAYQCKLSNVMTVKEAISFAEMFGIPKPDLIIFLDVDPKVAMQRKMDEEGHDEGLDIFERSVQKQEKLRKGFLELAEQNDWTNWSVVDGSDSIEEVTQKIVELLKNHKYL
jgi:dTMP kinase